MRHRAALLLGGCILLWTAAPAAAQRVNYGALEEAVGEPVTTSVTGKPQRASDAPAATIIITRDEIARSPARDVPGLLKTYAGIDVDRWTAGQSDVAVRGGVQTYNPRLLVLVNGRQVYLDHYGMTDWNLLGVQLDEIQQIELVRGPAGALFGFNAASGVVNIITVDPLERMRGQITADAGNHGYRHVSGSLAMPIGAAVGVRLSGGHLREDERAIPADQYQPVTADPVVRNDLSGTIDADLDPGTHLALTGGYASNRQLELLVTQITSEQRYRTQTAGAQLDHDTPWGSLSANLYTNWLQARYGIGATASGADPIAALQTFDLSARTAVGSASALVRLGDDNTGRIGLEYRDNLMTSDVTFSRRIGYGVAAINGMLDLHPADAIGVTLAARVDRLALRQSGPIAAMAVDDPQAFHRSFTEASFNAALLWHVGPKGTLRLNGGRGVQAPSLVVFGMHVPVTFIGVPVPVIVAGDPAIRPVVVWSGELGYSYDLLAAVRLEASAFYTRTDHAIAYPGDAPDIELRTSPELLAVTRVSNVGTVETHGVELSASGKLAADLSWRANYTLTATDEHLPPHDPLIAYSFLPKEATPRHKANLVMDYAAGRFSLSAVARYTSATRQITTRPDTFLALYRVPQAIAVDARLAYRLTNRLSLFAAGENLSNAAGAAVSPIPADRRVRGGATLAL